MNDISQKNFKILYPQLKKAIKNASFITIDAEFTGINSDTNFKQSLFDTLDDRYIALKRNIQQFIIIQFGIGVFNHVPSNNTYEVECYNFYLFPRSIPFKNRQFSWQVAALEFLHKYNFEFNKFLNEGISYLDEADEKLLKHHLAQGNLTNNLEHLSYEEEHELKECKARVYEWLCDDVQALCQLEATSPILQYTLQKEIRNSFKNVWTTAEYGNVNVLKVSNDMRSLLESEDNDHLEQALLDSYLGFSNVFKLLSTSRKPIIGHNILLDLMFMHQQFYKPLPDSYNKFKSNINTLFPQIYDTKFLSYELRKLLDKDIVIWKLNSLSSLYEYFTSSGKQVAFNSPNIKLKEDIQVDKNRYHNAGWDAYLTGYIFIRMGHIISVKKFGTGLEERPVTYSELMASVKEYKNCVNISRGNETYMKFDGADPQLSRPEWLHVKLKSPDVDIKQLIEKFSTFGQVDLMPFTRRRFLVAVASHNSALHILQHFENDNKLQVSRYSPIRHASQRTICLWSGLVISGSMFVWMLQKMFFKSC